MRQAVTVKEAEALLAKAKQWESAYHRLLMAAEEIEKHGYTVTITVTEDDNASTA